MAHIPHHRILFLLVTVGIEVSVDVYIKGKVATKKTTIALYFFLFISQKFVI